MAIYSKNERIMFAKWYAVKDLINNDNFWNDCKQYLIGKVFVLPFENYSPYRSVFQVHYNKECPVKHFNTIIPLTNNDLKNLKENARQRIRKIEIDGKDALDIKDGCQFERNGICTAIGYRPIFCEDYPVLPPYVSASEDGSYYNHLRVIASCPEIFDDIRAIYLQMYNQNNNFILLPDLNIVPNFKSIEVMMNLDNKE